MRWSETASCLKQVDAAQKFLRGIRQLPGYSGFADKQAADIKRAFDTAMSETVLATMSAG